MSLFCFSPNSAQAF